MMNARVPSSTREGSNLSSKSFAKYDISPCRPAASHASTSSFHCEARTAAIPAAANPIPRQRSNTFFESSSGELTADHKNQAGQPPSVRCSNSALRTDPLHIRPLRHPLPPLDPFEQPHRRVPHHHVQLGQRI